MKNPGEASFQIQLFQSLTPPRQQLCLPSLRFAASCCQNLCLCCGHQNSQNLSCLYRPAYQKMAQIPHVLQLFIIGYPRLCKIIQGSPQDLTEIFMHNPAVPGGHHIIKTASPVHSQSQRAILIFIAKGKFHLIPIPLCNRAALNSLQPPVPADLTDQAVDLLFFQLQLFLIRQALVQASAADTKMRTDILPFLQCRRLQHLQKPSFCPSRPLFMNRQTYSLSGKRILDNNLFPVYPEHSPVRIIDPLYDPLPDFPFFHFSLLIVSPLFLLSFRSVLQRV